MSELFLELVIKRFAIKFFAVKRFAIEFFTKTEAEFFVKTEAEPNCRKQDVMESNTQIKKRTETEKGEKEKHKLIDSYENLREFRSMVLAAAE